MNGSAASGIGSARATTVVLHDDPAALALACGHLFANAPFQSSLNWWRCTIEAALPANGRPVFALCCIGGAPMAVLPLLQVRGALSSLTSPYTTLYQPLIAPGASLHELALIGTALGHALRRWPSLRIDALDAAWPLLDPLLAGMRSAGWYGSRFDAFGNWHEPLAGRDWPSYLAGRPGWLRTLVHRKLKREAATLTLRIARTPGDAATAITAYRAMHDSSWKQPEPFPGFDHAVTQQAAQRGILRLGVLRHNDTVVAAQYWMAENATATVFKLAHDERAKSLSPGTLLTAMMIRQLLEEGGLDEIDFGRGDDAYKQAWATQRRQRIGLMLARPTHPRGLAILARDWLGSATRARRQGVRRASY